MAVGQAELDAEVIRAPGEDPQLLVFLAPRRFRVLTVMEAREFRARLGAAIAQAENVAQADNIEHLAQLPFELRQVG